MRIKLLIPAFAVACLQLPLLAQTIHPTPQSINITGAAIAVPNGFAVQNVKEADSVAVRALKSVIADNKKGLKLYIGELGDKGLKKFTPSIPALSGAYYLKVTPKEVVVMGYDGRGTYYGVQTLRQLLRGDSLAAVEMTDYPEIRFRGSVEGFYGKPWSHRDRLAQLKFYGENKLNTYIYGPKDDPYHSSLSNHKDSSNPNTAAAGWRVAYPEAEGRNITELAETAKKYKVDFVWAIHPGADIKWDEEDYRNLLHKFEHMYDLGVRSFAVFFDDISGEGTDPHKQAGLLNRLNKDFVTAKGDVTPLIMCPTEYNRSWANPKPDGYLSILGRELDPSVQIMWTGDRVCDDITMETLNWINERIKRPTYIWWNFPVTDYIRDKVLQGPSYGLDTGAAAKDMAGFVSNPMENAEASKIALYGVADYTWNPKAYDYLPTWEAALKVLMPGATEAYRTFAIHSADMEQNGHGFRRDESWETRVIDPLRYTQGGYDSLRNEFVRITQAPAAIMASGDDKYLIEELTPWLEQFKVLGERGLQAMDLMKINAAGDEAGIWNALLEGEMTRSERAAYNAHKSGTYKLRPFIANTRTAISEKLYESVSGQPLRKVMPMTSFERKETLPQMMDGRSSTYFYSWGVQKPGDWVGVDLGEVKPVTNVLVEQGRKAGDNDYFKRATLEYSTDGADWSVLADVPDSTYRIAYNARPVDARYVRLRALEGVNPKNWVAIRRFDVNPKQDRPIVMTNVPQVAATAVLVDSTKISLNPMLEVLRIAPGGYVGIELPLVSGIRKVDVDLNRRGAKVEYSSDGAEWSSVVPASARYVRFANHTAMEVEIKLNKFEIELAAVAGGDVMMAFDQDLSTGFALSATPVTVAAPKGDRLLVVLAERDAQVAVTLIGAKGVVLGMEEVGSAYTQIALPEGVLNVEMTGTGAMRELIFRR